MVWCLGLAPLAVVGLVGGMAPDLGLVPLAAVEQHWSPSLLITVVLGHIGGHVAMGVDEL